MGNAVRTVGPLQAPKDRGSPRLDWSQIDGTSAERRVQSLRFRIFRNRLERHAGKLARAVLRGGGDGDTASLPDVRQAWRAAPGRRWQPEGESQPGSD